MRLFVLVAALMLVLLVAEKARDPRSWNWFFALNEPVTQQRIDNRLEPPTSPTQGDPVGTVVIASEKEPPNTAMARDSDPATAAWRAGLKDLWGRLTHGERTLWFRLLETAQDAVPWPTAERPQTSEFLTTLRVRWKEYDDAARASLESLKLEEKAEWERVLDDVGKRFQDECLAPLELVAAGTERSRDQHEHLSRLLAELVELTLRRVRDDTPFMQPGDNQIWHHLFWNLKRAGPAEIRSRSRGEIAYAQLYRQPAQYRGQIVTVHGAIRRAYRDRAAKNDLGIKEYFVFWVQPFESADNPLVVYALDVPPGFPPLADRDRNGEMTKLDEEATFHGYLFKRGAYAGQQGTNNAPLLLASAPSWEPAIVNAADEAQNARWLWQGGAIAFVVALVIAVGVYWSTFRRSHALSPQDEGTIATSLRSLQDATVLPPPEEALRAIEQQARETRQTD